ncbi:MAG TPA: MBL fold metallo-hydrolase, partial [Chitinophagaceae bacterium]|nr:MBL fold metallo-hydrolase [Chitinophagaceae bacterium]
SHRRYRKHSGILIDSKVLLDVGERDYLRYRPQIILITHLHPDHAFFVAKKENTDLHSQVYAPEASIKVPQIKNLVKPLLIDEYKIIPVPVVHSLKVRSQGYILEKENIRIFYSGDIVEVRQKHLQGLGHFDAVITEASFIRKGGIVRKNARGEKFGHAGIPELIQLFRKHTQRIILTHFGTWFIKDPVAGRKKLKCLEQQDLKIEIPADGFEYSI